jgi:hypothetical protein
VPNPTAAAQVKTASDIFGLLLETRNRQVKQATPAKLQEFKEEAGRALRKWATVTEEQLEIMRRAVSRGHGRIPLSEAQGHWELLDQLRNDIYRYVEDRDSLLEDYEPLQRAAAPETLQPFWSRFDTAFDMLESYKDTLSRYQETYAQQPMTEIRKYEIQSREDSHLIRSKLREFVVLAQALMQIIGKL